MLKKLSLREIYMENSCWMANFASSTQFFYNFQSLNRSKITHFDVNGLNHALSIFGMCFVPRPFFFIIDKVMWHGHAQSLLTNE